MSKTKNTTWKCDLCFRTNTTNGDKLPRDWVLISVADTHEERSWHEKHICNSCQRMIEQAQLKKGS